MTPILRTKYFAFAFCFLFFGLKELRADEAIHPWEFQTEAKYAKVFANSGHDGNPNLDGFSLSISPLYRRHFLSDRFHYGIGFVTKGGIAWNTESQTAAAREKQDWHFNNGIKLVFGTETFRAFGNVGYSVVNHFVDDLGNKDVLIQGVFFGAGAEWARRVSQDLYLGISGGVDYSPEGSKSVTDGTIKKYHLLLSIGPLLRWVF